MKKKLIAILAVMVLITGCGNKSDVAEYAASDATYANGNMAMAEMSYEEAYYDDVYDVALDADVSYTDGDYDTEAARQSQENLQNRKLITTAYYNVETEEFDELTKTVEQRAEELGGYIQSSNFSVDYRDLRTASYTIRVPESNLNAFAKLVETQSNITYKNTSVEDVTLSYVDIQSRQDVYKAEEERLIEMMDVAEDIDTLLSIETRLSEVQAEIESMEATLRSYDNMCTYSTIYLNVEEVEVYTVVETREKTTWEKISEGFMKSLKDVGRGLRNFFIWFIINIPHLVVWGVIITIIVFIIKGINKIRNRRKEKKLIKQMEKQNKSNDASAPGTVSTKEEVDNNQSDK